MPYSLSTLLIRNLQDVFGEGDPLRRRTAIDEIYAEDCIFIEPRGVYHGRDEIDRDAGLLPHWSWVADFVGIIVASIVLSVASGHAKWVWKASGEVRRAAITGARQGPMGGPLPHG